MTANSKNNCPRCKYFAPYGWINPNCSLCSGRGFVPELLRTAYLLITDAEGRELKSSEIRKLCKTLALAD